MEYTEIKKEEFIITGISVRTINRDGKSQKDIAGLWERFMREQLSAGIPDKINNDIYCLYTDYESDHTGEYTTILGHRVHSLQNQPEDFESRLVPATKYRVYKLTDSSPMGVGAAWDEIWRSDIDRKYTYDFDVYHSPTGNPADIEMEIWLSVK